MSLNKCTQLSAGEEQNMNKYEIMCDYVRTFAFLVNKYTYLVKTTENRGRLLGEMAVCKGEKSAVSES